MLIDEVYEKHYEKYAHEFGKTILGFFSDEPMVGNIAGGYQTAKLGGQKPLTNPWQKDMPDMLRERLGENWAQQLPLLWGEGSDEATVRVRTAYMDAVTRLIEKNFAGQLGDWCKAHGVEYIGHIWEDKHLSYALGGGLVQRQLQDLVAGAPGGVLPAHDVLEAAAGAEGVQDARGDRLLPGQADVHIALGVGVQAQADQPHVAVHDVAEQSVPRHVQRHQFILAEAAVFEKHERRSGLLLRFNERRAVVNAVGAADLDGNRLPCAQRADCRVKMV